MFGAVYAAEGSDAAALSAVAQEFSPRIEVCGPREVTLDLSGLTRLFGDARTIAEELRRTAADRGLRVRIALAGSRTAARLLVRHQAGVTVAAHSTDATALAAALAGLPLELLAAVMPPGATVAAGRTARDHGRPNPATFSEAYDSNALCATFRRWGLRTLGDVAALPPNEVAARLGQAGTRWQRLARGEDARPLVPHVEAERFEQALDLEWPIEGLEPLSFVLGRLMEPLAAHLERRDRGAAVLYVRLHLVTKAVHERSLQLPAPMRDARTLRTLALLDLESHPPSAAIDRVVVAVDPTPARTLQYSLLTRPQPSPEQLSTLMARLGALMGEGRCGSPAEVDSWKPGAFGMKPFAPVEGVPAPSGRPPSARAQAPSERPVVALRRFRFAVPARVMVEQGRPVRVYTDRRGLGGGSVAVAAGPWRTSGQWWERADAHAFAPAPAPASATAPSPRGDARAASPSGSARDLAWDRDEWDVALDDGATYRVFRERDADAWFIDGIVD
jgi:protein ImuB